MGAGLAARSAWSSALGYDAARMISHEPLYHALSRVFFAEAVRSAQGEAVHEWTDPRRQSAALENEQRRPRVIPPV
ncbi:MAG: hypothetical protein EOR30_15405 [Mesorhizobium sp.]|uniref:hypothetical protein n=1 Tax=unclassified Mesorhizobium TaxID=325217 RepID=UPI000FCB0BB3|nr:MULTISPECIES: hypothetical protein [unclassified Mesorhizobium]RUV73497.1 hypothetical protein EOA78_11815 [Mesorhizobium sp. M5C.F.Cr.IN.023.01.1.1]RWF82598.1 MAG: hypothetical protein EOQ36_28820 [Mesorhizobium sp.]RWF93831.1 MAG: hypothetical protein EOQ45_15235 [Mesorhizobium sp.]RWI40545.1 MAG: hypothetical protein EOR14_15435 [Mesorhizobium sp.]RWI53746.1 MAG: hypothetical protein EOR15_03375 [Mesorhizobium sp.]